MGFLDRLRGNEMEDPVPGEARVLYGAERQGSDPLYEWLTLHLSVSAEGLEPTDVEWTGTVRADKRPRNGVVLPVTVDRANPERLEILWDEAPNVVWQMLRGTTAALTEEQRATVGDTQAKTIDHSEELMVLAEQFKNGEIDQDELLRRQNELLG